MGNPKRYLGDGLYAEWNGYQMILKANDEENPSDTVYLDPHVITALLDFVESINNN